MTAGATTERMPYRQTGDSAYRFLVRTEGAVRRAAGRRWPTFEGAESTLAVVEGVMPVARGALQAHHVDDDGTRAASQPVEQHDADEGIDGLAIVEGMAHPLPLSRFLATPASASQRDGRLVQLLSETVGAGGVRIRACEFAPEGANHDACLVLVRIIPQRIAPLAPRATAAGRQAASGPRL